jgi:hypothetical protein
MAELTPGINTAAPVWAPHDYPGDVFNDPPGGADFGGSLWNYRLIEQVGQDNRVRLVKVGLPLAEVGGSLVRQTGGWPKRAGDALFVRDGDRPRYLDRPAALFAWAGARLRSEDGTNPVNWARGSDMASKEEFHAHLQQTAEAFAAVEAFPHHPPMPEHYYIHPEPKGGTGAALAALLGRFNPATEVDAALVLGYFLTLVWGGRPGTRPGFLFTGRDDDAEKGRGIGKTTLAEAGAELVGGCVQVSPRDDMPDVRKRLLSPDGRGRRVLLLDNIKTLRFSWDELERLITGATVSGRQLYVGEGQRPNNLTVTLTLNGASLSKDMAQRCVIVVLDRPAFSGTWKEETARLIGERRWEILGDLLAVLRAPAATLTSHSRWGAWEDDVLARLPGPASCQRAIAERQDAVDDDREESELVRDAFVAALRDRQHHPDRQRVLIPSKEAAMIVAEATGERMPVTRVSPYLKTLSIAELRKSDRQGQRGWEWNGADAPPDLPATKLYPKPQHEPEW